MRENLEKLKIVKEKLNNLVAPFLNDSMSSKQRLELAHCAKFIVNFDENIKIILVDDAPDVVVEYQGEKIGIEIARLFNQEEVVGIKSKQAMFDKAATELAEKYPSDRILGNFRTVTSYQYSGAEPGEIAEFVHQILAGTKPDYPAYITEVMLMPHSGVSLNYNEGVYSPAEMPETSLNEAIAKKEVKYASYVKRSGTDKQWLLLVSEGVGSDSFDLDDYKAGKTYDSQFEHIYLLQNFQDEIITIR